MGAYVEKVYVNYIFEVRFMGSLLTKIGNIRYDFDISYALLMSIYQINFVHDRNDGIKFHG